MWCNYKGNHIYGDSPHFGEQLLLTTTVLTLQRVFIQVFY